MRQVIGADTNARVDNRHHHFITAPREAQPDIAAFGRELDGIPNEVGKHLQQTVVVSHDDGDVVLDLAVNFDLSLARLSLQQLQNFGNESG